MHNFIHNILLWILVEICDTYLFQDFFTQVFLLFGSKIDDVYLHSEMCTPDFMNPAKVQMLLGRVWTYNMYHPHTTSLTNWAIHNFCALIQSCLLYTSDAADD